MTIISSPDRDKIIWNYKARTLHWGLALCIFINLINDGDGNRSVHEVTGYLAFAVVVLRLIYGFFWTTSEVNHAKFKYWPIQPSKILNFIKAELMGQSKSFTGHNPVACLVYMMIWLNVGLLATTGFMMGLDQFWGEEWLEELHELLSNSLLGLLLLHAIGIAKDAMKFKRKTWMRMVNGQNIDGKCEGKRGKKIDEYK